MTNRIRISINKSDSDQLVKAVMIINGTNGKPFTGCNVELSDYVHKDPTLQYVDISFSDYQVLFDLAKTFGIILQKVNPQPL